MGACSPCNDYVQTTRFPLFAGFTASTPVIPQLYWDVYSAEERWKKLCCWLKKLTEYADSINVNVGINADDIDKLEKEFETFKSGGLLDFYEKQIAQWIQDNMEAIIKASIKQVYFGLTDDTYSGGAGYFVAYIPESWNEIVFDTGATFGLDTYGRLILRWDADSPYSVEQTPEYSEEAIAGRVTTIETTANNAMSLAETNEKDIGTNDGEIADLQTRVTALEGK